MKQEIQELLNQIDDNDLETLNYIRIIVADIVKEMK
jgi:hypothetical protein